MIRTIKKVCPSTSQNLDSMNRVLKLSSNLSKIASYEGM